MIEHRNNQNQNYGLYVDGKRQRISLAIKASERQEKQNMNLIINAKLHLIVQQRTLPTQL